MALIKDSIEEIVSDDKALLKYILYTIPIWASYELFNANNMILFYFVVSITSLMLLNILSEVIHNTINGKEVLLPSFNIIDFCINTTKAIISIAPASVICSLLALFITSFEIPIQVTHAQLIFKIIIWAIFGAIILTMLILYSQDRKIKNAYNVKIILNCSMEILIGFIFYIIQAAIVNGVVLGLIGYVFSITIGLDNIFTIIICSFAIPVNIAMLGQYLAQLEYEIFPHDDIQMHEIL